MRGILLRAARALGPVRRYERWALAAGAVLVLAPPLVRGCWDRVLKVSLAAAVLCLGLRCVRRRRVKDLFAGGDTRLWLLLLGYALLSCLWAPAPVAASTLFFRELVRWGAIALVVRYLARPEAGRRVLLRAFAGGAALTAAAGLVEAWQMRHVPGYRVFGPWDHPNLLGAYLAAALPLVLTAPIARGLRLPLGAAAVAVLWSTGSRAGWAAAVTALVVAAGLRRQGRWLLLTALLAVLGSGAALLLPTGPGARVPALASPRGWVAALAERPRIWRASLRAAAAAPLTGHGYGRKTFRRVVGVGVHAHNTYLEWLLQLGLVGVGLHLAVYGRVARRLWRRRREPLPAALLGGGSGLALQATVEALHQGPFLYFVAVLLGLGVAAGEAER